MDRENSWDCLGIFLDNGVDFRDAYGGEIEMGTRLSRAQYGGIA